MVTSLWWVRLVEKVGKSGLGRRIATVVIKSDDLAKECW